MRVVIVGEGAALYFLARKFVSKGFRVTVVDPSYEECLRFSTEIEGATVIHGDGSDPRVLHDAGAGSADAVLAVGPRDPDNLVACQLSSLEHGVEKTLAVANDPDNVELFEALGVPAFSSAEIIAGLIEARASVSEVVSLLPLGQGQLHVTEIVVRPGSPAAERSLQEIDLPPQALIAAILRDQESPIIPHGADRLKAGDRVVLVTLPGNHGATLRAFTGERA
jgi:trk/ktr system potassium uptake protein